MAPLAPIQPNNMFPDDFAIKHALRIAYAAQRRHADIINFLSDHADAHAYAMAGVKEIGCYADFFTKPIALPLFKYRDTASSNAIEELNEFMSEDSIYEPFMTDKVIQKITRAIAVISSITKERHVCLN